MADTDKKPVGRDVLVAAAAYAVKRQMEYGPENRDAYIEQALGVEIEAFLEAQSFDILPALNDQDATPEQTHRGVWGMGFELGTLVERIRQEGSDE